MKLREYFITNRHCWLFSLVLITLCSNFNSLNAQHKGQGGLNLLLGFPQDEFRGNMDNIGVGIAGDLLYLPPSLPIGMGLSIGVMVYGADHRREPFSTTIPDVEVEVTTTNNVGMGHLLLRTQGELGILQPYLDGLFGFSYFYTRTKIEDIGSTNDEEIASTTNLSDFALSYGAGGGIMIKIHEKKSVLENDTENDEIIGKVFIDLRIRYIAGGEAEYLKKGSIQTTNGNVIYDINKSTTDLITTQIGVTVEF